ncbi:MAG: hypothetical protein EHM28_12330, partial [Spirochaetaceae bacterium]
MSGQEDKLLATCSEDGTIKLSNMAVSSIKLDFPNPFGSALALSFSTDGKTLIAGCSKGSVIIYNTGDGSVVRKAV